VFSKLLIANRGEIALRVIRACRELGVRSVAVYSDADAEAPHVREADEAVQIGPSAASASYLDGERLIAAAKRTGAEAIHPGYGFLSEREWFARLVRDRGLVWIGPSAESIAAMGSKTAARTLAVAAGVPVVPGTTTALRDAAEAAGVARQFGYPVLLKAAAGGGGKGMRIVREESELAAALDGARREATKAFGDDAVYVEKYIEGPRHVEIQLLADTHGTVLALGEGLHHVFVHSHDTLGLWGPPLDISLPVDLTGPGVSGADVAPNPTNGVLTPLAHPGYLVVSATITDPSSGTLQNAVTDAEGFLDTVGAGGTGFQLAAVDGAMNSSTESVMGLIPISQIKALANGTHFVSVRGRDAAGNWGPLYTMNLIVDKVTPVLLGVTGSQNQTTGVITLTAPVPANEPGGFAAAQFWLGTTDPGVGKATSVPFAIVGTNIEVTVPLAGLPSGALRFNLRVQDKAGNWSNAVFTTVTVRQNAIFSNGFTVTTTPFGWSSRTGTPTVTLAAGIPLGGTNRGLQVTEPGGAKYVTDNSPTAEMSYHASFAFNASSLNPGAAVLTLFEARTGAGAQVLAVQLRRASGFNQIGTVMSGSAGPTTWVNLPAGAHTIRVDWAAATAGSLQLSLDGSLVSTQTGDTSTLLMETARLGITAGAIAATTGTAYFDSFSSTRFTLP